MDRVLVIAEAGVNHNGSLEMALRLVEAAAEAGADIVKFQTFRADRLATAAAPKASYQERQDGTQDSQLAMLRRLELDRAAHEALIAHAAACGIEFLSTPFDEDSLDLLVKELGIRRLKVPSGEITNGPLLLRMAQTGLPVILSTGMASLSEVEQALAVLAYGYGCGEPGVPPGRAGFEAAYQAEGAGAVLAEKAVLLHCTTEYPAPFQDVNLRAMDSLRAAFGLAVGYSDHTAGIAVPIAAVARGAVVIEKHFTLDRTLPGPDHQASLEPGELSAMLRAIREVEQALGDGRKVSRPSELKNRPVARKSLVAARAIAAGAVIQAEDITTKRPGTGLSPMNYWDWLGRPAPRAYMVDAPLGDIHDQG